MHHGADASLTAALEHYHWLGALLTLAGVIVLTRLGKFLAFRVPALAGMKAINRERDREKLAQAKYPPMVKASQRVGLYSNIVFFLVVLPFCVTLEAPHWWAVPLHIAVILMVYDFFYYLMHRFLFHGQGKLRRVHTVHHQARRPTHIDAHYVHPLETFLGLNLFFVVVAGTAFALGALHPVTVMLAYVIYVQLNVINHTFVDLPYFPFKTLDYITSKHHRHHENMGMGNYSTITLLFDKLFGTYE